MTAAMLHAYQPFVLRQILIDSSGRCEYSLEVRAEAHVADHRVNEVPWTRFRGWRVAVRSPEVAAALPQAVFYPPSWGRVPSGRIR